MALLIIGLFVFLAIHLLPTQVTLREKLQHQWGELGYKGVFSVVSLIGFIMIVIGKGQAEFIPVWTPPVALMILNKLLMLPAMILVVAAYVPNTFIKAKVRHPMLAGVKLWAVGHLLANGDVASMVLFGSFLAYAVVDMISANKRGTAKVPANPSLPLTVVAIVVGGIAYALLGIFHMHLFGVAIR